MHKLDLKPRRLGHSCLVGSLLQGSYTSIFIPSEELGGRAVSALGVRSRKLSTGLNGQF
jgi:hypothetical protein